MKRVSYSIMKLVKRMSYSIMKIESVPLQYCVTVRIFDKDRSTLTQHTVRKASSIPGLIERIAECEGITMENVKLHEGLGIPK